MVEKPPETPSSGKLQARARLEIHTKNGRADRNLVSGESQFVGMAVESASKRTCLPVNAAERPVVRAPKRTCRPIAMFNA